MSSASSLDREKIREDFEWVREEHGADFERLIRVGDLLALLDALEQAERERDEWRQRCEKELDKVDALDARLSAVPALVEAYERFDDVIACLADARHADYGALQSAKAAFEESQP